MMVDLRSSQIHASPTFWNLA